MIEPIGLANPTLEEIGRRLGKLYGGASLSRDPMFSWVQIANDVTILGEELRRGRSDDAVDRAGKILMRLLEFLGYYLYVHQPLENRLSDALAISLRARSYDEILPVGPQEGPSRWILVKYPYACSKCGKSPCHCLVEPWTLENRREEPEGYLERFKAEADKAREKLKHEAVLPEFTLDSLLRHFEQIYRNSYWSQDPWKLGMHLSEELGEATIELSRINLQWMAQNRGIDLGSELELIFQIASKKVEKSALRIRRGETKRIWQEQMTLELGKIRDSFETAAWETFGRLVRDKFKEEVSDVFSWLAAVIVKLDPERLKFRETPEKFSHEGVGGVWHLACPWCHQQACTDSCLLTHGVSSEITEKLSKF